jgi:uncharacterized protein (DUF1499 family)
MRISQIGPHRMRAAALLAGAIFVTGCWPGPPATLGERGGSLAPCPSTPNCVHTGLRHPDGTSGIFLAGGVLRRDLMPGLRSAVESMPRTTVVSQTDRYLHAVVRSRVFRFRDDLELFISPDRELIVRSASRVGNGDLGANLARVADLRQRLIEAGLVR